MPTRKGLMDFLIGATLFYLGITAFLYVYQRNMLYFPGGPRPEIHAETAPEILPATSVDGITLEGLYWPARAGFPTLVFFHGNGQAYQYWANKLSPYRNEGYGVLFTDYRGYGGYPGAPSEQGVYTDARSFLTALHQDKGIAYEDMVYFGESLGTGVAIQMATEFKPKALILESAYSSTIDIARSRYWMFPLDILMKDRFRSIEKIPVLDIPKFFIHAEKDKIIPIRFGRKLYEAAPEPKEFKSIPIGGHNDLYENGAALHILSFLSKIAAEQK